MVQQVRNSYDSRITPWIFDLMVASIWLPTRIGTIREGIVDLLELQEKTTVLEIGSGTGGITERMIRRGARVTCIDQSAPMMARARLRAPQARYVQARALGYQPEDRFDRALLAFFLHEQESRDRIEIIGRAAAALAPDGLLVVADTSAPGSGLGRVLWRAFVRSFEPPTVLEVVDGALEREIVVAGLEIVLSQAFANGRARVWVAQVRPEAA